MIIRTQDKMTLVNLDQVMEISIVGKTVRCQYANGVCRFLGTYLSEEKALDIMDNIAARIIYEDCEMFQMPDDEEISITETDKDLADALNTVDNYKKLLFGR